jgi:magnesium transporter
MVNKLYSQPDHPFTWIDVVDPDTGEIEEIALEYGLHGNAIEDCLEPMHLPKIEFNKQVIFCILRAYDEKFSGQVERVQQITRKVAIFSGTDFVITVRRKHTQSFTLFLERYRHMIHEDITLATPLMVLVQLIHTVAHTYESTLEEAEFAMDKYEMAIFNNREDILNFEQFYKFKRKLALIKKMLRLTGEIVMKLEPMIPIESKPIIQDVKEIIDGLYFQGEEMLHDGNNLVKMHISIGSYRTNEIIRVLTIFTAFLMPMTLITGIYGMNFEWMPELKQSWGYPMVYVLMAVISGLIYTWFRRKGWL